MSLNSVFGRVRRGCERRAARWLARRPFTLPPGRPIVSFTFDDFPKSALTLGGAILRRHNAAGTYYTSLGLAGRTTECGRMFDLSDLPPLLEAGHELGCHTHDHFPAWSTSPPDFEASVARNAAALERLLPGARFATLSYPISHPRPETKRRIGHRFDCCRGGGQTFNAGTFDLNYVSAFFIEQSLDQPEAMRDMIARNAAEGGWLIFATHDVAESPTRFGCTPEVFEQVVASAVQSGAAIAPVGAALATFRTIGR